MKIKYFIIFISILISVIMTTMLWDYVLVSSDLKIIMGFFSGIIIGAIHLLWWINWDFN